ncbi:MAG: ATPase, T2SS/T4P/T4SS family [Pseudomonadota bacterium]|jgi:twitching motility protein PilT
MLNELTFSDIYLGESASLLGGVPGMLDPVPAPPECREELAQLRKACGEFVQRHGKQEFAIREGGTAYRVSVLRSLTETVYVLRRFPSSVPDLSTLGIHPGYVELMMQPGLAGLLVIAGAYGQGKTTTASSVICARVAKYGGVCVTIEDPPEMPLEGRHGEGVIYQTWVEQGGFGQACRQAARWVPSIIFLGEIRDSETAAEALRASINGRLVVCTTHADSAVLAVDRLFALANGAAGTAEDVASLLANGLVGVLHQRLDGEPKRPRVECLWLGGEESQGPRNSIRRRQFAQLQNDVTLQLNRMLMRRGGAG